MRQRIQWGRFTAALARSAIAKTILAVLLFLAGILLIAQLSGVPDQPAPLESDVIR